MLPSQINILLPRQTKIPKNFSEISHAFEINLANLGEILKKSVLKPSIPPQTRHSHSSRAITLPAPQKTNIPKQAIPTGNRRIPSD